MRTSGNAAWNRPFCRLAHGVVTVNIAVFVAAQAYAQFAWGQREPISTLWFAVSAGLIFVHILTAFVWAWIDGEPIQWDDDSMGSGSDMSSDANDGGSGDGGDSSGS
ncbi:MULTISPECIES: hypothetical protein [Methylobacterium]|uniref:2TM domain-containing protein n=1 Tax=Methylobacterium thuringiense TaxID=1003091 RepID=A0ABQ4TT03_9HYPH|nr:MULTISPECIES: hypothetical protein [Methylobacterium]TXN24421.1 hypothetical protein FV217_02805 [Methylobacterium sp. WL9]GJE57783.1 hypothetical protein EKPJFOCH_4303 [Methylobacterium thuringiense]